MASPWLRRTAFGGFLASAMLWVPHVAAGAQTPPTSQPPVDTGRPSTRRSSARRSGFSPSAAAGVTPPAAGRSSTGSAFGPHQLPRRRQRQARDRLSSPSSRRAGRFPTARYYTEKTGRLAIDGGWSTRQAGRPRPIRLDRVPEGVPEVGVAKPAPTPANDPLHRQPRPSGALWVYTPGRVRQVYLRSGRPSSTRRRRRDVRGEGGRDRLGDQPRRQRRSAAQRQGPARRRHAGRGHQRPTHQHLHRRVGGQAASQPPVGAGAGGPGRCRPGFRGAPTGQGRRR